MLIEKCSSYFSINYNNNGNNNNNNNNNAIIYYFGSLIIKKVDADMKNTYWTEHTEYFWN